MKFYYYTYPVVICGYEVIVIYDETNSVIYDETTSVIYGVIDDEIMRNPEPHWSVSKT